MAPRQSPLGRLSALGIALLFSAQRVEAGPYPRDDLHAVGYGYLMPRQCDQYCGYNNMYCCSAGSTCYTSNGIAGCSAPGGGGYAIYTTTWTQTQTYTSTFSSFFPAATAKSGNCVPPEGSGQVACGSICCAKDQYCAYQGQCLANGYNGGLIPTTVTSGGIVFTTQFSAPYRVTNDVPTGVTDVPAGATTTGTGLPPGAATDGGGLSPGAIAGIVIGTIAGIILLLLICFCCVVRGLWHGALAILGIGKKKKSETVIEEERYRRSSSRHSGRDHHGSWYGGRPSTVTSRKEKKSSGKGLLGLGAALGTLWLLLGLKKDKKSKKSTKSRSDVSSSYWSDSYTADSPSSMSSDRRTRRSRRSGTQVSRTSRVTRTTRVSRAPSHASRRSPPR